MAGASPATTITLVAVYSSGWACPCHVREVVICTNHTLRITHSIIYDCWFLCYSEERFMGMTTDGLSYWQADTTDEPLLNVTIGDLLDQRAEELPTQEAIVYSGYPEFGKALDIRWTYKEYCELANQTARGLMALGLQKGDHIAVWAANLPEWL